jgi:hypothetical protein
MKSEGQAIKLAAYSQTYFGKDCSKNEFILVERKGSFVFGTMQLAADQNESQSSTATVFANSTKKTMKMYYSMS